MLIKKLIFVTLLVLLSVKLVAQDSVTSKINFKPPTVYAGFSIGGFDAFSLSVGTKINERISAHIIWGIFWFSNDIGSAAHISIGSNYYFNWLGIFRYGTINTAFLYAGNYKRGYTIQWLLGNRTDFEDGFGFMYEVGAMYHPIFGSKLYHDTADKVFLEPVAKIGWIYNF